MKRITGIAILLLLVLHRPLAAQDARLRERLDARTADAVSQIVASASAQRLPTEPLIQKALEGATKGADSHVIERVVRDLAARLATARKQLGELAAEAELAAAASALYAGIPPGALARLRALRPQGSLAMPLVALTFFIEHGIGSDSSLTWIESIVSLDIGNEELLWLQQSIDADVRAGAAPGAAVETRVEALLRRYGPVRR